jgi:OOP family OmpA-OmpF porin
MMMKFSKTFALTMVLGTATMAAQAEGLYVGGSLGETKLKRDNPAIGMTDTTDTAVKAYAGYSFNPNFSLEAGVARFGKFEGTTGDTKAHATYLDAVGLLPVVPNLSVLGRIGVYDAKLSNATLGADHTTGIKLGAGLQYDLSKTVSLRTEWERYGLQDFGGHHNRADVYTVGVNYKF